MDIDYYPPYRSSPADMAIIRTPDLRLLEANFRHTRSPEEIRNGRPSYRDGFFQVEVSSSSRLALSSIRRRAQASRSLPTRSSLAEVARAEEAGSLGR